VAQFGCFCGAGGGALRAEALRNGATAPQKRRNCAAETAKLRPEAPQLRAHCAQMRARLGALRWRGVAAAPPPPLLLLLLRAVAPPPA